jgi:hypothetical protein
MSNESKPYKNREEVKKDIRLCSLVGTIWMFVGLGSAVLGIISDALNITLGLESMSWFLLAIFFAVVALGPMLTSLVARHLYGIESENKTE